MLTLERGPLDRIDPAALRPFPPAPAFASLAITAAVQLGAQAAAAGRVARDVGADLPLHVDDVFALTIAPAADALGNETTYGPGSPVPGLVAQGDNNDVIRQSVLGILPQPDSEFPTSFQAPPAPPGGQLPDPEQQDQDIRDVVDQRLAERGVGQSAGPAAPPAAPPAAAPPAAGASDPIRDAIEADYVTLLGRPSDPGGLANWLHEVNDHGHSLAWVSQQFIESDEYKRLHPDAHTGGSDVTS